MYSICDLEQVCFSMSSSNLLPDLQISQEAGQVVWYSHLFKDFPQFVGIHTVKGFGIVNKAEVDYFLELSCFSDDPMDVGNLISGSCYSDKKKGFQNLKKTQVPFIAALFTIARTWKQPRCPSTDEWIKKLWYIFTM